MQATVLAAQAFTSLIPFMVVVAAFAPGTGDLADRIVDRFDLTGASARSVQQLFASAGETQSAITWISIVILLLSALSFTRALQRIFQRAYRYESRGVRDIPRGFGWIAGLANLARDLVAAQRRTPGRGRRGRGGGDLDGHGIRALARHADAARRARLGAASRPARSAPVCSARWWGWPRCIYVPIAMTWSADRYGLIGVAFALQSWLLVTAFVVVVGAVVGATVVERAAAAVAREQDGEVGQDAPQVTDRAGHDPGGGAGSGFTKTQGTVRSFVAAAVKTKTTELGDSRVRLEVEVPSEALESELRTPPPSWVASCASPAFARARFPPRSCCARSAARPSWTRPSVAGSRAGTSRPSATPASTAVGDPKLDLEDLPEAGLPLSFTIEVGIVPPAKLGDYKGLEVGRRDAKVDPDEVQAELERLRESLASLETVERAAGSGDFVVIDFVGSVDGEPFEGGG